MNEQRVNALLDAIDFLDGTAGGFTPQRKETMEKMFPEVLAASTLEDKYALKLKFMQQLAEEETKK